MFLRELISNASDSLEKYRYKQVNGEVAGDGSPLEIRIVVDKDANTISITDNGIGMSRDDLISNLGTIARSGSKNFVEELRKEDGSTSRDGDSIIGQFGVGFYSSFMVSDKVTVESSPAVLSGDSESDSNPVTVWSSDGSGVYTVETSTTSSLTTRGSKITMHLKESCKEFAEIERGKEFIVCHLNR